MPNYPQPGNFENQFYLLFNTARIFLSLPLSPLPLTRVTHVVSLLRNVSQCVQILAFNISNRDFFTQLIQTSLIQITTKVNMRFFFLLVYIESNSFLILHCNSTKKITIVNAYIWSKLQGLKPLLSDSPLLKWSLRWTCYLKKNVSSSIIFQIGECVLGNR